MKQLARPHREPGVVHPLVVEMTIHAIEPTGHPPAARFQEREFKQRVAIANAAHDEARRGSHHFERMSNAVTHCATGGEAIHRERGLSAFRTTMDSESGQATLAMDRFT